MTIQQIKSDLSIEKVLAHYGLKANSNWMLCCPFHPDKKPSMKVYPKTNTVYCFAGNCEVNNLDAIDFIMEMDKTDKHQALLKAQKLITPTTQKTTSTMSTSKSKTVNNSAAANFATYQKSLKTHKESQAYCNSRSLDWRQLEMGYKSRTANEKWGRGCLIFPLKDGAKKIVSLYGRSIKGNSHYYQSGRSGLYPAYPNGTTKRLILT